MFWIVALSFATVEYIVLFCYVCFVLFVFVFVFVFVCVCFCVCLLLFVVFLLFSDLVVRPFSTFPFETVITDVVPPEDFCAAV